MSGVKTKKVFTEGPLFFRITTFAIPIMLTGILQVLYGIADNIVVGRFSGDANALASVGTTGSLVNLITTLFMGIAGGTGVVVSQYYGARNDKQVSRCVHTAMLVSAIGGVIMMVFGLLVSRTALEIMGVNSASYLILPKIMGMMTMIPVLVVFSTVSGICGAYATAYFSDIMTPADLTTGLQYDLHVWYFWMGVIKSFFFAFIIASVPAFFGYTVEGGSTEVGKASTNAVVTSSVLVLFADLFLTQLLS